MKGHKLDTAKGKDNVTTGSGPSTQLLSIIILMCINCTTRMLKCGIFIYVHNMPCHIYLHAIHPILLPTGTLVLLSFASSLSSRQGCRPPPFNFSFFTWKNVFNNYCSESGLFCSKWWPLAPSIFPQLPWSHSFSWLENIPLAQIHFQVNVDIILFCVCVYAYVSLCSTYMQALA